MNTAIPAAPDAPLAARHSVPDPRIERIRNKDTSKAIARMRAQQPVTDALGTVLAEGDFVMIPAKVLEVRTTKRGQFIDVRAYDGKIVTLNAVTVQKLDTAAPAPEAEAQVDDLGQPIDEEEIDTVFNPEGTTGAISTIPTDAEGAE